MLLVSWISKRGARRQATSAPQCSVGTFPVATDETSMVAPRAGWRPPRAPRTTGWQGGRQQALRAPRAGGRPPRAPRTSAGTLQGSLQESLQESLQLCAITVPPAVCCISRRPPIASDVWGIIKICIIITLQGPVGVVSKREALRGKCVCVSWISETLTGHEHDPPRSWWWVTS